MSKDNIKVVKDTLYWSAVSDLIVKWYNHDKKQFVDDINNAGMVVGNKDAALFRLIVARMISERLIREMYKVDPRYKQLEVEAEDYVSTLLEVNKIC